MRLVLPHVPGPACPVTAMRRFLRHSSHCLVRHSRLVEWPATPARTLRCRAADNTAHNARRMNDATRTTAAQRLRIEIVTAAAATGVSDGAIRAFGRWAGSSHLRYVRGPRRDVNSRVGSTRRSQRSPRYVDLRSSFLVLRK